jgi:predicted acetyltransferase
MKAADRTGNLAAVAVRPARASERALIEGLFQFYMYDFSELEPPDSASFEVDAKGRFATYPQLDEYWRDEGRWPLLISSHGRVAGFALVNTASHRGGVVERNMAEFFVARKHRHLGVASEALVQILRLHPGQWEVAVAQRNVGARAFWAKALAAAPDVSGLHLVEGDGMQWRGPIWCFRALAVGG